LSQSMLGLGLGGETVADMVFKGSCEVTRLVYILELTRLVYILELVHARIHRDTVY